LFRGIDTDDGIQKLRSKVQQQSIELIIKGLPPFLLKPDVDRGRALALKLLFLSI
jgi:hypothetical protein